MNCLIENKLTKYVKRFSILLKNRDFYLCLNIFPYNWKRYNIQKLWQKGETANFTNLICKSKWTSIG